LKTTLSSNNGQFLIIYKKKIFEFYVYHNGHEIEGLGDEILDIISSQGLHQCKNFFEQTTQMYRYKGDFIFPDKTKIMLNYNDVIRLLYTEKEGLRRCLDSNIMLGYILKYRYKSIGDVYTDVQQSDFLYNDYTYVLDLNKEVFSFHDLDSGKMRSLPLSKLPKSFGEYYDKRDEYKKYWVRYIRKKKD
jgi:hypothetical protein